MAESTQEVTAKRPKPKAGGSPAATAKTTTPQPTPAKTAGSTGSTAAAPTKPAPRFGFFQRLGGRKEAAEAPAVTPAKGGATAKGGAATAATGTAAATPAQRPKMGRFFLGMSLYLVLAFVAQFVLAFIFARVPGRGQSVLFTLPLLGPVTQYLFVWMLVLIVILWGLYKFNILPRTLGGPRQKIAAVKADPKANTPKSAEVKALREPVSGPNDDAYARVKSRLHAERRKARRH